jgi:hypothetical protein
LHKIEQAYERHEHLRATVLDKAVGNENDVLASPRYVHGKDT